LKSYGKGWHSYRYDVHVGGGITVGEEYDEMTRRLAKLLTQKRIDVVAIRHGVHWLFEVKPQAALSAVGQLLGYRVLYEREFKTPPRIRLAVVTDLCLPDDRYVFESHGIRLFLVQPEVI